MANKKKTNSGRGAFAVFLTGVVALIAAAIMIVGTVVGWFNFGKKVEGEPPKAEVPGDEGNKPTGSAAGGTILGESKGNGIRMMNEVIEREEYEDYGIDTQSDSAYTITATIEPADATFRGMIWTVKWQDETSEWVTNNDMSDDVLDYVTVTPTVTSSGNSATVVFTMAFGEPIEITVALEYDEELSATVVCDYLSAVESVGLNVGHMNAGQSGLIEEIDGALPLYLNYDSETQKYRYAFLLGDVTYSVGTVRGDVTYTRYVLLQHSTAFMVQLERRFATSTSGMTMKSDANTQNVMLTVSLGSFFGFDKTYLKNFLLPTYLNGSLNYSEEQTKQMMFLVCAANKPHGTVRVSYQYTYEGKTYASAYTEPRNFYYDATDLGVAPTGVGTDKSHIVVS